MMPDRPSEPAGRDGRPDRGAARRRRSRRRRWSTGSSSWCRSRLLRARREASRLTTRPAVPSPISAISFWKPWRSAPAAPDLARILVDDVDALARPAQPDGAVDEPMLQLRALPAMADLAHRGLAHVDAGELGAVDRGEPLVSRGCGQHGGSPRSRRVPRPASAAAAARRTERRPAPASVPADPAIGVAAGAEPTSETLHDVGAGDGRSWGTSSSGDAPSMRARWRARGSSVRTLTRRGPPPSSPPAPCAEGAPRSVAERRIERRLPSGSATTTKAGPRPERAGSSASRWPASA